MNTSEMGNERHMLFLNYHIIDYCDISMAVFSTEQTVLILNDVFY